MEFLHNGYTLDTANAFPLSTDSMVLAHFASLGPNARVLDLGSGSSALGMLLCAGDPRCHVTGIEIDPMAHEAALGNISRNHLEHRISSICGDLRTISSLVAPGSFSCCVSNPPYFSGGPVSRANPTARREDCCSLSDLMEAASHALKYGGDFFLVHRPERLGEIIALGAGRKLEAKRLCLVRHRSDGPVALILVQLRKGGKPGLKWEEIALHTPDGEPTPVYREIYHI